MSYNEPRPRRKSPCCIGLIVVGVIILGFIVAVSLFSYRFVKDRVEVLSVLQIADPPPTATPEEVLPAASGDFRRVTLSDNITTAVPGMGDVRTSGVAYGLYKDQAEHEVSVIALPTRSNETPDLGGFEKIIEQRNAQKSNNAVSFRDTFSGPESKTIITWSKPNWTFIVQSTSTLATKFVKDLNSNSDAGTTGTQILE